MKDWPVEAWVLFLTIGVTAVIAALTKMAVEIIKALKGVSGSVDRAVEAANGLTHELVDVSTKAAHARGKLEGIEQSKSEVTVPVHVHEITLGHAQEKEE